MKLWRLLAVTTLWVVVVAVEARVVGLVVDDSGSMKPSFQKALFAAQLLVASLNSSDRVLIARLNGAGGQIEEPPPDQRGAYLDRMRRDWKYRGDTPYAPLSRILDRIVEATGPDEEAALLVFTDGNFSGLPDDLKTTFATLKQRFRGRGLAVYFVSLPGEAPDVDMRGALLGTFNGAPDAGAAEISRAEEVFPGLRDVITELAGGDPAGAGQFVRRDGNRVRFKLPFGTRRLVILSTGDSNMPASGFVSSSFPLAREPTLFEPAMGASDPGENVRLRARVTHLLAETQLAAGREHTVVLDRPLRPDDRIIFDSDLRIEVDAFDARGRPLKRDAARRLHVVEGEAADIRARFLDKTNGTWKTLELKGSGIVPEFTLNDGLLSRRMGIDAASDDAVSPAGPYGSPGTYNLTVEGRISGLKYLRSEDLVIEVETIRDVNPQLNGRHVPHCPDCASHRVELAYAPGEGGAEPYEIEAVVPDARGPGDYLLELDGDLPPGVSLVGPNGTPVLDGGGQSVLRIDPRTPVRLRLRYDDAYRSERPARVELSLAAAEPGTRGESRLSLDLVPVTAPLQLVADGHTLADQNAPFVLPVTRVGEGDGVFVAAEGLRAPLRAENITLATDGPLPMRLQLPEDDRILVAPELRWSCDCLTPAGSHAYTLLYSNSATRQSARFDGVLEIQGVPWGLRCWQEMLFVLAVVLAMIKFLCLWRTDRFPPKSRLYRFEMDSQAPPQRVNLHRPISAFFSCRDERRQVLGIMTLVARPSAVEILPGKSLPDSLYHAGTSEYLQTTFESNGGKGIRWGYSDQLRDDQAGCCYLLVHDHTRFNEEDFYQDCR